MSWCRTSLGVFTCLFTALSLVVVSEAQELSFSIRSWRAEQGLPDNFVNQVVQDQRGYLWVGTAAGLARFDSVSFKEFRGLPDTTEFGYNIRDMAVSPSGSLLTLPASGGVVEWKDETPSVHPITASLSGTTLRDLFVEPGGAIWAGGEPTVLVRWENGVAQRFGTEEGINRRVNRISFAVDGRGRTWVASGEFLGWYHQGRLQRINQPMSEIGTAALIASARSGGVWIACAERLLRMENDRAVPVCGGEQWPARRAGIQCMVEDSLGRVWIGTRREGLYVFADGAIKKVALESRMVTSVIEDNEGNIWAATEGEGLCRLRPQTFTILNTKTGFSEDSSTSVCTDKSGAVWCANRNGGLVRYIDGVVQHYGAVSGGWLFASRVAVDSNGGIWMGSSSGVYRLDDGASQRLELLQPVMRGVNTLYGSRDGNMWVGSSLGLGYFHEGVYQQVENAPHRIDALAENSQGKIWMATSESHEARHQIRLFEYSAGRMNEALAPEEWSSGPIHVLYFDRKDSLWIGSAGGLVLKQGSRLTRFTTAQGLPDDLIAQILEDDAGYLWMAGRRALFRIKIDELQAVADGKLARGATALFGADDGLQDAAAPGGGQPRAWKGQDGRLWFTLHKGVVGFDPNSVALPRMPPPLYIEEVRLDQRVVRVFEPRLEVPAGVQRIKIRLAVLDYSHPEHVIVRYKLEGFDRDWIEVDRDRTASYARVPAGNYRLVVTAVNQSGVWAEQEASLLIGIAASWWQTGWFMAVVIVLAVAVVAWLARIWSVRKMRVRLERLEKEHALERERARIARNLHDELGGSLTQIGLLAERLRRHRNLEEIERTLGLLIRRTQGLATDLESIVWTVSPQNNSWDRLASFIGRYARLFFDGSGIECRLEGADAVPALPLEIEAQHEVLAISKEAMNNVLKHSKASTVTLRFQVVENVFELVIQDNGSGFEPSLKEHTERNGLHNMRTRAVELHGQITIESQPGAGTLITLRIPVQGGSVKPSARTN